MGTEQSSIQQTEIRPQRPKERQYGELEEEDDDDEGDIKITEITDDEILKKEDSIDPGNEDMSSINDELKTVDTDILDHESLKSNVELSPQLKGASSVGFAVPDIIENKLNDEDDEQSNSFTIYSRRKSKRLNSIFTADIIKQQLKEETKEEAAERGFSLDSVEPRRKNSGEEDDDSDEVSVCDFDDSDDDDGEEGENNTPSPSLPKRGEETKRATMAFIARRLTAKVPVIRDNVDEAIIDLPTVKTENHFIVNQYENENKPVNEIMPDDSMSHLPLVRKSSQLKQRIKQEELHSDNSSDDDDMGDDDEVLTVQHSFDLSDVQRTVKMKTMPEKESETETNLEPIDLPNFESLQENEGDTENNKELNRFDNMPSVYVPKTTYQKDMADILAVLRKPVSNTQFISYGFSERQGKRSTMEDRWCFVTPALPTPDHKSSWFSGVYDGHNGPEASAFLYENLSKQVTELLVAQDGALSEDDVKHCLHTAFMNTDRALLLSHNSHRAGSTASTVLHLDGRLYCANTGDSRTVLCRGVKSPDGSYPKQFVTTEALSFDQKPTRPDEKARIIGCGGKVFLGRLMGQLAVSRAFGDSIFKKNISQFDEESGKSRSPIDHELDDLQEENNVEFEGEATGTMSHHTLLIADPEVHVVNLHKVTQVNNEVYLNLFVIIACDGLWDVFSNKEAADFIVDHMNKYDGNCTRVLEALTYHAIHVLGSSDNVTALLVLLEPWVVPNNNENKTLTLEEEDGKSSSFMSEIESTLKQQETLEDEDKIKKSTDETMKKTITLENKYLVHSVLCNDQIKLASMKGLSGCANMMIIMNQRIKLFEENISSSSSLEKKKKMNKLPNNYTSSMHTIDTLSLPILGAVIIQSIGRGMITRKKALPRVPRIKLQALPEYVATLERLETEIANISQTVGIANMGKSQSTVLKHLFTQLSRFKKLQKGEEKEAFEISNSLSAQLEHIKTIWGLK